MKKVLCLLLSAAMILSLAACSKPAETQASSKASEATTTKAADEKTTAAPTEPAPTEPAAPVKKTLRRYGDNCATLNPGLANSAEDAYQSVASARLYRKWYNADGTSYIRPELAAELPKKMDAEGKVW